MELELEYSIGHPSATLEHTHYLIQNLLKCHWLSFYLLFYALFTVSAGLDRAIQ
jgi:hypothetical protein